MEAEGGGRAEQEDAGDLSGRRVREGEGGVVLFNIENNSGFELSNIVYYELENKTEEEIKEFFRTKSYGHPSSLMWRKFYFEILKPNFL